LAWLLAFAAALVGASAAARPITVADSIQWTYVLPKTTTLRRGPTSDVAFISRDRRHFVIHTRRGDLAKGINIEQLLLFTRAEPSARGNSPWSAPKAIAELGSAKDDRGLSSIRWIDDSRLGFIAPDARGTLQAYEVDIASGRKRALTRSQSDVLSFAASQSAAIYTACAAAPAKGMALIVHVESHEDALPKTREGGCLEPQRISLHLVSAGRDRAVAFPQFWIPDYRNLQWMSPDGRFAILLLPSTDAPEHWSSYKAMDPERWSYSARWRRSDPTSVDLINRDRYMLVDTATLKVRPLFDAPSGLISFNLTPPEVFWLGGSRMIVTNTFLPLGDDEGPPRSEKVERPATIDIDLATGSYQVVFSEPVRTDQGGRPDTIVGVDWDEALRSLVVRTVDHDGKPLALRAYSKRQGKWISVPMADKVGDEILQVEALNERPRVYSVDPGDPDERSLVYDPNPEADRFQLSQTKIVHWSDSNGVTWTGGLLLPPGYRAGGKYPLVVQTHGFDPAKFLLDGPAYDGQGGTAMAAQALAARGFIVLQVEDNRIALSDDVHEVRNAADGYYKGIKMLLDEGLADPRRIGLIAFSRTGLYTLRLIADHPGLLAAVSISDSFLGGYMSYLSVDDEIFRSDIDRALEGKLDLSLIGDWFARNPIYSAVRSNAAFRLEEMGSGLGTWELFELLKRNGAPVDFTVYPDGSHVLQKPQERLSSQGGSIDWFDYWLNGREDPDPGKKEQYERWEKLRSSNH
jgi:dipeptidyl aminopeptidase/acylaminoacyl peptidase